MSALEHTTQNEPIVGWRVWRVLKTETLRDGEQFRLCAVGTRGVPKSWEPRTPVRAVCSSFKSRHEAPHPEHECGVYGLRSRTRIEKLLDGWKDNQGEPDAWALGRVSLWGRVVEFELGWRAEYGYPYEVTVFSNESAVADEVRRLYAVDVEIAPALVPREPESEADEDDDLEGLKNDIGKLRKALELLSPGVLPPPAPDGENAIAQAVRLHGPDSWQLKWELTKALRESCADQDELVSAVAEAIATDSEEWECRQAENSKKGMGFLNRPCPHPVADSRTVTRVLASRVGADAKLIEPEHVGRVAVMLLRLAYADRVTLLRYYDSTGRCHWHPGALSDDEIAALNVREGEGESPRERYRTLCRAPDEHGEEDTLTVRTLHRLTKGTVGSFVRGVALLEAFPAKERPRNLAVLGHSLVRNKWRGLVEWNYQEGRSSGTKQWGLTSAGVAAAEKPIPGEET